MKPLIKSQKWSISIFVMFILMLVLGTNVTGYADITPVKDRTPQVRDAIVNAVPNISDAANVTAAHLAAITSLNLRNAGITALKTEDFSGMTGLITLNLFNNALSSLPDGIFEGLTSLKTIRLGKNSVDPLPLTVSLEKVGTNQFKAVVPSGATFDIVLPITVTNGSITGGTTTLTIPHCSVESGTFKVTRTPGTTAAVTVDIGTLPSLPKNHYGYALTKSDTLPIEIISETVTINVTDIDEIVTPPITPEPPTTNSAPSFDEGDSTTRVITENTPAGTNIGNAVLATDANNDSLGYSLGGNDADTFDLDSSGQLKTKAPLDYETKRIYLVTITVDDEELSSTITVIISVIDVNDTVLSAGFVPVAHRTPEVRDAIVTAVPNVTVAADVTESQVAAITNLNLRNKGIASLKTGDFSGMTSLSNLNLFGNQLSSLPAGTFDGLTALSTLRLGSNAVDPIPLIVSLQQTGNNTFKAIIPVGAPFNVVLPIRVVNGSMSGGMPSVTIPQGAMESTSFTVIGTSAEVSIGTLPGLPRNHFGYELAQSTVCNRTAEVAAAIATTVGETDCSGVTELDLATITTLDLSGQSIASLSADDFDGMLSLRTLSLSNNDLTSLPSGIFDDLISLRELHLNSNNLTTIPQGLFEGLTQLRQLHLSANLVDPLPLIVSLQKVGRNQLKATVPSGAPFTIELPIRIQNGTLAGGATALRIPIGKVESQLLTVTRTTGITDAVTADIGTLPNLPSLHNGYALAKGSDGPLEILPLLNSPPVFTDGATTTRTVAENTVANANIGPTVAATDRDKNTLTYTLGGTDAAAFTVDSATGQLKTKVALDYETKSSYTVTLTVSDGQLNDVITVTINVSNVNEAPTFTDGSSVTREIAENTSAGENIGAVITATDPDNDTLTYSLGGTDASAFVLGTTTGQLRTSTALDYETKSIYTLVLTASDGNQTDTIAVTINVTDVQESSEQQVVEVETPTNNAPIFIEGNSTTRTVLEGTSSGVDIGTAVSATDADGHSLTYTLSGSDAAAFSMDSTSGQIRTSAALDYESGKTSYSVTITVSDGNGGTDTITVTINVIDLDETPSINEPLSNEENSAPTFAEGNSTTRSVAEGTGFGVDIGTAVSATDPDNDTATYSLGGTDAVSFSINSTNGQLRTKAVLDYETKTSYSVIITVSDGRGGSDSITVTINITDVQENRAPVFSEGSSATRSVPENTASGVNIGNPISANDADNDTLTYALGGTNASSFSMNSTNGQLRTSAALDYETKSSYTITITVSDGSGGSDSITVTINVTDVNEIRPPVLTKNVNENQNRAPVFTEGTRTTRTVAENTANGTNIGTAVTATDADNDTLTYTKGWLEGEAFSIDKDTGQIRTKDPLDYETKNVYRFAVFVDDGKAEKVTIIVTINVTDVNETPANNAPVFNDGDSTTRSVAENTASSQNIGTAISATDVDSGNTLTYTLGGTDADSFSIISSSGQLQTSAALNYENKSSYSVTVSVSDGNGGNDSITVTVNVTNVNEAPVFTDGSSTSRSVAENTASGQNIGTAISATDVDSGNTLTYTLGGTDADSFSIVSTSGQIQTSAVLNYESKTSYSVTVSVSDGNGGSDSIDVTINVTDVNETPPANNSPVFTDGDSTTRSVAENTASGQNIGTAISATDVDSGNTLTYTLGGTDADSFSIVSTSGQIQTSAALNYEAKTSYSVTVSVSDSNGGSDSITVTINVTNVNEAPVFTDGDNTTRSIAENTASAQNIGTAISATDVDSGNTLTYSLGGTDADAFGIVSTSGQIQTSAALDYESKSSYSVSVSVSDGNGGSDSIAVTINVTNVNEAPSFNTSERVTLSVAENTASGTDIGDPFQATDPDSGDTVTYSLQRADKHTFRINANTGQLQTHAALDYETKSSYSKLAVRATDSGGLVSRVLVTINVTNVNETLGNNTPSFTDGTSTTRTVAENTASDTNIGTAVAATDADSGDTLTYTLSGTDASSFSIVSTSGQLQTSAALDYETKNTYSVTVSVADGNGGTDSIDVSISVTDVDEAGNDPPTFTDGTSTTRSVAENTASGTNIGTAVAATDSDSGDTLTYTLGGTDAASFSIVSTSGQLQTSAALDYETKKSYSVTVSVSDGNGGSDSITVTINITDVNETGSTVSTNITTCSVSHKSGNVYDVTIAGTVTGNRNVRFLTVHGYVNDDPDEIGRDSVGFLDAGETKNFSITGTWTHDGSTSQECSVVLTYQTLGAPSAQSLPAKTALLSNYPNPFNPETWIPYQLAKPSDVTITVYDIRGRVVRTLILGHQSAGVYRSRSKAAHWDGKNEFGEVVASGVYFYRLTAGDFSATRKMLIRK